MSTAGRDGAMVWTSGRETSAHASGSSASSGAVAMAVGACGDAVKRERKSEEKPARTVLAGRGSALGRLITKTSLSACQAVTGLDPVVAIYLALAGIL